MKKKSLSDLEIEHIAWLARIELTEHEKIEFSKQLNEILEYFSKIDKINVESIRPTYHVLDLKNVLRKDEKRQGLSFNEFSTIVPTEKGFSKAQKIV